ncbi:HpcH/HpaI aldolase/citrate lyase family protein [Arthrobacter sp. M4]|uniref:HpcH/HpaI aldolase family protein n=1 Tax=Arthrobacter sp. M4 TaxID=218160 RepID=UPI001CDB8BE2|nr:aldolase/citrate lyase family protein [Arthrobacter sp. M4]MCA4132534.1 hypothetical protein [Arthrobacter sp. M4]
MNSTNDNDRPGLSEKLGSGRPVVGLIVKMVAPAPIELAGHLGFDFALIDTEHGVGGADLDNHIRAADSVGLPALVRVGELNRSDIARALDSGAAGVAVPQVSTREEALQAVSLAHYPPMGSRGLATSTRAGRQGTVPGGAHIQKANAETVVVVQIESEAGVANALEIMNVPGVSAVWIGLTDLTLEMGHLGNPGHPDVQAALESILDAAERTNTPVLMIADSDEEGQQWTERGIPGLLVNFTTIISRSLRQILGAHRSEQLQRTLP